jgi:pimeloyl-ACP methyl ester carboxylesterase
VRASTIGRLGAVIAATLVVSCASGTGDGPGGSGAPGYGPVPPASGSVLEAEDDSRTVDIGGGRTMFLECRGTGSPTVVLVAGTGNAGDVWRYVQPGDDPAAPLVANDTAVFPTTARSTRVCAYDRPGTEQNDGSVSRSSPVAQPTSIEGDVADLRAVLVAAEIPGPYVLVGHSLGGMMATAYARTYPDDLAGLVLIDPASELMETTMGPDAWRAYVQAARSRGATGGEHVDLDAANAFVRTLAPLPPMPVVVLSSDVPWFILPFGPGGELVDYSKALVDSHALLAESLGATHVTKTDSAHDIYLQNAPLVNEQICALVRPGSAC